MSAAVAPPGEPSPAEALLRAARVAARRGEYPRAGRLARRAATLAGPEEPIAAHLANFLGGLAFEVGDLTEAEARFEDAIFRAQRGHDPQLAAKASNNLAMIAHLRGKLTLAEELYRSALLVYRRQDDVVGVAQTEHNLGLLLRGESRHAAALEHAEQAVLAARGGPDRALLALTLMGRAESLLELGQRALARHDFREARVLVRRVRDRVGAVEARRLQAIFSLHDRQYAAALRTASRGYLLARRLGYVHLSGECAMLSAQASSGLERPRLAARYRRNASACFHALGDRASLRRWAIGPAA